MKFNDALNELIRRKATLVQVASSNSSRLKSNYFSRTFFFRLKHKNDLPFDVLTQYEAIFIDVDAAVHQHG